MADADPRRRCACGQVHDTTVIDRLIPPATITLGPPRTAVETDLDPKPTTAWRTSARPRRRAWAARWGGWGGWGW